VPGLRSGEAVSLSALPVSPANDCAMAKSRQVVILKTVNPADDDGDGLPSMGSIDEIQAILARFNTAHDNAVAGRAADMSLLRLHGPGLVAEFSTSSPEVKQIMVTMTDDDFAFPVLARACREQKWTLMDPESGQRLRF